MLRTAISLLVFFVFAFVPFAKGNTDPNCGPNFAKLDSGHRAYLRSNFLNSSVEKVQVSKVRVLGKRASWWSFTKAKAQEELNKLKSVPLKDVVQYHTIEMKAHSQSKYSEIVTMLSQESKGALQQYFDATLEGRIKTGDIPRSLATDWRDWLRKQPNSHSLPYPNFDEEVAIKKLIEDPTDGGTTVADLFNLQFLRFLNKEKGLNADNVEQALKNYPKGFVRELYRAAMRPLDTTKRIFFAATAAVFLGTTAYDLVHSFVGPVIDPLRALLNSFTKSMTEKVIGAAKIQYTTKFQEGPEKYKETIEDLRQKNLLFLQQHLEDLPRGEALGAIENHKKYILDVLPKLSPVVEAADPEYIKKWKLLLESMRDRLATTRSLYSQNKIALESIHARVAERGTPMTDEEADSINEYTSTMREAESQLAIGVAAWVFYKSAIGESKNLEPSLDSSYQILYDTYAKFMDLDLLKKELADSVRRHAAILAEFK